ncbi:MAG TPA: hypothetical protein VGN16_03915 [Acidobacteriaceae bacterium]|jgi:hypothetical protein
MLLKFGVIAASLAFSCGASLAQGSFAEQTSVSVSVKEALNSKSMKAGDQIVANLEKPATVNGVEYPGGSQLLGHIVDVTRHDKDTPNGSIILVWEQIKPKKGGDPVSIRASIYKILPSDNMLLAQRRDVDMGMRGTGGEAAATSAVRETTDRQDRTASGSQSASSAPVQVVSAIPGVALSAVASDTKSGILTSQNKDVDISAGVDMVVGVTVK